MDITFARCLAVYPTLRPGDPRSTLQPISEPRMLEICSTHLGLPKRNGHDETCKAICRFGAVACTDNRAFSECTQTIRNLRALLGCWLLGGRESPRVWRTYFFLGILVGFRHLAKYQAKRHWIRVALRGAMPELQRIVLEGDFTCIQWRRYITYIYRHLWDVDGYPMPESALYLACSCENSIWYIGKTNTKRTHNHHHWAGEVFQCS